MFGRNRRQLRAVAAWFLFASGACVSSSIRGDVAKVRALSQAAQLSKVAAARVDSDSASDARELLKKPLDADAAVRIALHNNRELRAQLRELGITRARVMQAGLLANPVLEVEVLPERDSSVELRVEYEVTSLLMAPLRQRAAERELEAARFETAAAVVELGYHTRLRFYAFQAGEQRLAVAQQLLDTLAAARDAALALLAAGNVPPLEASTQVAAYERARIMVAERELEVATLREELQRMLGLYAQDTQWTLAGPLEPVPEQAPEVEKVETRALQANLDLRAADRRLDALARRTGIARTEGILPEVAVDMHSLYTDPDVPGDDHTWRLGGGVSVRVPLFDHGQAERRGYEAQFDAALERYQGLAIDLRSRAREARNRVLSSHARAVQFQRVIVPAQRTVLEHTLLQYNAMQLGVFQLLSARRELLDVELAYVDTLRDYWSAQAEYDALLAGRVVEPAGPAGRASLDMGAVGGSQGGH